MLLLLLQPIDKMLITCRDWRRWRATFFLLSPMKLSRPVLAASANQLLETHCFCQLSLLVLLLLLLHNSKELQQQHLLSIARPHPCDQMLITHWRTWPLS